MNRDDYCFTDCPSKKKEFTCDNKTQFEADNSTEFVQNSFKIAKNNNFTSYSDKRCNHLGLIIEDCWNNRNERLKKFGCIIHYDKNPINENTKFSFKCNRNFNHKNDNGTTTNFFYCYSNPIKNLSQLKDEKIEKYLEKYFGYIILIFVVIVLLSCFFLFVTRKKNKKPQTSQKLRVLMELDDLSDPKNIEETEF